MNTLKHLRIKSGETIYSISKSLNCNIHKYRMVELGVVSPDVELRKKLEKKFMKPSYILLKEYKEEEYGRYNEKS